METNSNVPLELNTHFVANLGLGGVITAVGTITGLLSNGDVLLALYHRDPATIAKFAGALIGAVFAGAAAYLGRPKTVPASNAPLVAVNEGNPVLNDKSKIIAPPF